MGSTSICIALVVCVGAWAGYARAEAGDLPDSSGVVFSVYFPRIR